jgi:hypothetical protein
MTKANEIKRKRALVCGSAEHRSAHRKRDGEGCALFFSKTWYDDVA